jgi:PAS domain S-box-containing protein
MESPSPTAGAEVLNLGSHTYLVELFPTAAYAVRAPDGVIAWFNSRAAQLWGRVPVIGDTDERFCGAYRLYRADGTHMAHCDTPVALTLETGTPVHEEEVIIERPDGSRVTVSVHIDPIRDMNGAIVGVVNFFQDIGERKQADRNTRMLAAIVETSEDAIIGKNLDGIITSWNTGAERIFGFAAKEAIGQHILLIVPSDRWEEEATILEQLHRGERVEHFETVRKHKDGTKLDIALAISPLRDAAGRLVGASTVARDITRRKQAERALEEQARLLNLTTDAVFVRDAADRVTYWNKAASELYGYMPEEALGRVTHELLRTEFPSPLENIKAQLCRDGRWSGELLHKRKDDTQVIVASRWVLDQDAYGNPRIVLETNSDITKHKQAEQDRREAELSACLLRAQDEERRRIARELHDGVGQLLAGIGMNLSRVEKEKAKLSPATARCVEENASLLGQASAEIRTMSYLLHPPLLEEVGLQSALRWYIDGFTERSKIKIALDLDSDLGRLPQNYELSLFRIAQECLTNIHRHSGSFTALVRLSRASEEIALEVTDEGRGISQETQLKLTSGASAGVGFRGMQERVRLVGGTLTVHSNGNGTSVRVVLPLTAETVASDKSKKLKADEKYEGRSQETKSPAGRSRAVRR